MKVKKYKSGLTVIVAENKSLRSVTAGVMVGAGSAHETRDNNGISHFIEHMQFKGTARRSAQDIVDEFDRAGATFNAFTGKEYTCYYFKSIDENVERCVDVLSDLFLHSQFEKSELDRERKVILEEINMSLDEPDGVCYDVLYKTAFGDAPIGMEILGTRENVSRFEKADITEYKKSRYLPSNTVIAFAGNITESAALGLVEKFFGELTESEYVAPPASVKAEFRSGYGEFIRDYEQSEISVAFPSPCTVGSARSPIASALDQILGSGMGSRLFRRLREQMGLVYSVYSTPWMGKTNGLFTVCANVNSVNVRKSLLAIREEIDKVVRDGVTPEEVEKAKTQLKVSAVFGTETPMNYMLSLMRWRVLLDREYDVDEIIRNVEKITKPDVDALAREIFAASPALAYAGKGTEEKLDKIWNDKQ